MARGTWRVNALWYEVDDIGKVIEELFASQRWRELLKEIGNQQVVPVRCAVQCLNGPQLGTIRIFESLVENEARRMRENDVNSHGSCVVVVSLLECKVLTVPNGSIIFQGCIPALMTPCDSKGEPMWDALVAKAKELIQVGMRGVVYCGSMGDWPLLTDAQRQVGVRRLVEAGVPVVVGTGAQNPKLAAEHAAHARKVGAAGLMVIPRVLSRGSSTAAQREHFAGILRAADGLPAVIYNSPYYGFETKADLFFNLRSMFPNLIGFKEFGGAESLTYAAEHITTGHPELSLMVGVDTQVFHGVVRCGAVGAITGVGNALPKQVLRLLELCLQAASGDVESRRLAAELNDALSVLSTYDEGPDLVLYYKHLMVLEGNQEYANHFNSTDGLALSQRSFLEQQWQQFRSWWDGWAGKAK